MPALVRYIPYKTSTRRHHGHTDTAYYPACEYHGELPEEPDSVTTKAISGASTTPPVAFTIHTSAMPKGSVVLHRNRVRLDGHAPHQFPVAPVRARRTATWLGVVPVAENGRAGES